MALNVKNRETERLVKQLAALTGESLTEAITAAVRERIEREEQGRRPNVTVEHLLEIGRRCAREMKTPTTSADHNLLYDDRGLPL